MDMAIDGFLGFCLGFIAFPVVEWILIEILHLEDEDGV